MTTPCGCGDPQITECFCALESTEYISVGGSGTADSPYRMTLAEGVRTTITETDTDTVDMHVTENSPGSYDVSADVVLSGDAGNVIGNGSDGGLFVPDGTAGPAPIRWLVYQETSEDVQPAQFHPLTFDASDPGDTGTIFTVPRAGTYLFTVFVMFDGPATVDAISLHIGDPNDPEIRLSGTGGAQFATAVPTPIAHMSDIVTFDGDGEFSVWVAHTAGQQLTTVTDQRATRFSLDWLHA